MGFLKFTDDPSLKFQEDLPTLKTFDDPKLKIFDDPIKFKYADDIVGSLKAFDDVKLGAFDKPISDYKLPGSDQFDPRQLYDPAVLQVATAAPFVLSTPHHSMAWMQTFGAPAQPQPANDPQTQQKLFDAHLDQIKASRQQLQNQIKQLDDYEKKVSEEFRKQMDEQRKTSSKK